MKVLVNTSVDFQVTISFWSHILHRHTLQKKWECNGTIHHVFVYIKILSLPWFQ